MPPKYSSTYTKGAVDYSKLIQIKNFQNTVEECRLNTAQLTQRGQYRLQQVDIDLELLEHQLKNTAENGSTYKVDFEKVFTDIKTLANVCFKAKIVNVKEFCKPNSTRYLLFSVTQRCESNILSKSIGLSYVIENINKF